MASPLEPPPYWIPVFFAVIWCSVSFLISRFGWSAFARKYPATTRPPGPSFNCPSAWFSSSLSSYNNAVRLVFTEAGLYVYPFVLFRLFHDPFLIPWDKISPPDQKRAVLGQPDTTRRPRRPARTPPNAHRQGRSRIGTPPPGLIRALRTKKGELGPRRANHATGPALLS